MMQSLIESVCRNAKRRGSAVAVTFHDAKGAEPVTYSELIGRVECCAAMLRRQAVVGDRILLCMSPGLGFIEHLLACLWGGLVAVPTYPPGNEETKDRFKAILEDCKPAVIVCDAHSVEACAGLANSSVPVLPCERAAADPAHDVRARTEIALLQYTSGSTMRPKGVVLSQDNIAYNVRYICERFRLTPRSVGVIWLPPYHDMGLIGGLLAPLYRGFPVHVFSPTAFLKRPLFWLRLISETKATITGGPNLAFELCARRIGDADLQGLDLSSLEVCFCGSEPIRRSAVEAFVGKLRTVGLKPQAITPCYGLAEATLLVTGCTVGTGPQYFRDSLRERDAVQPNLMVNDDVVSCGRASYGTSIAVVDPETNRPTRAGDLGEVCVSGPGVASTYWGGLSIPRVTLGSGNESAEYLRTGDLGFISRDCLYVVGRLKNLVIVGGRKYLSEDVEGTLANIGSNGQSRRVLVFQARRGEFVGLVERVGDSPSADDAFVGAAREILAARYGFLTPLLILLRRGEIPRTPTGKLNRSEAELLYSSGIWQEYVVSTPEDPQDDGDSRDWSVQQIEQRLLALVAQHLAVPVSDPGVNLIELGGDSLMVAEFAELLSREFGIAMSIRNVLDNLTIRRLAAHIHGMRATSVSVDARA